MSLNGLDAVEVVEAYQSAGSEGGGWFLLRYTNRAEVGILRKGTGGLQEAREAVSRYDEQSPLYGFVQYRRRKVLLKYVPEGTSRLLQARLAVHFQSIAEKFSPHDTVFSFTTAAELADSALSAACSLHTAPASIRSASSLRRKALAEITEDASENQVPPEVFQAEEESITSHGAKSSLTRLDTPDDAPLSSSPRAPTPLSTTSSTNRKNSDKALPPIPKSPEAETPPDISSERKDETVRPSLEGRRSSSSSRPPTRERFERYDANGFKLKAKIGPRPSLDSTDPASGGYNPRPTSSLPASVRMPLRKAAPIRNSTQTNGNPIQHIQPTSAPAKTPSFSSMNPPFAKAIPSPPTPVPVRPRTSDSKSSAISPEKRRLMKAVELRRKQLAAQKVGQGLGIIVTHPPAVDPPLVDSQPKDKMEELSDPSAGESVEILETVLREDESGVIRLRGTNLSHEAATIVDASPISLLEASEGPSTQASSVSEDEAVPQEKGYDQQASPSTSSTETGEDATPKATAKNANTFLGVSGSAERNKDINFSVPEGMQMRMETSASAPQKDMTAEIPSEIPVIDEMQLPSSDEPKVVKNEVAQQLKSGDFWKATKVLHGASSLPNAEGHTSERSSEPLGNGEIPFTPLETTQTPQVGWFGSVAEANKPQEVPLPPISEDERLRPSPQQASLTKEPSSQSLFPGKSQPQPADNITSHPHEEDDQSSHQRLSAGTRPPTADTAGDRRSIRLNRRHGLVEPIRRVSSGDNSDDQFLSDDSFMEELKSATVQEAKPIRVSKSPIAPEFPRPKSEHKAELVTNPRSVSSPIDTFHTRDRKNPSPQFATLQAPRAVSVSQRRSASPSEISPPMLKKLGVSSGISQRIKALETLSSRPTSPSQTLHSPANPPPAFSSLNSRKTSFHSRPGTSDRPSSRKSPSPTPTFDISSPKLTAPKPYNQFVSVSVASKPGKSRPESISVTAKIVRDDRNQPPEVPFDLSEPQALNLHHSPLKFEHRTSDNMPPPSNKPPIIRHATAPSNSSTSTDHKRESFLSSKRDSFHSNPNGSRRGSDVALSRSTSEVSLSGVSPDGRTEEKKESRKSRLLKRMSTISSASRRSIATALSPTPTKEREEPIAEQPEPIQQARPAAVEDMGDINIQFPDTLLWKRRHMTIDPSGTLVLSPTKLEISSSRAITKRYSLLEFHPPYIPDQDRQEMPNSVNLDFRDGSTLQCACENLAGQARVLGALVRARGQRRIG